MAYQELVRDWNRGVLALEKGNLDSALNVFRGIENPPSKIEFNIGCLYLQQGDLDQALETFHSLGCRCTSGAHQCKDCHGHRSGQLFITSPAPLPAFDRTVSKDNCLAVGFFQRSYIYLQLERYDEALEDGRLALLHLRNNPCINYKQLGLAFVLCASEVLYNMAATHCRLGRWQEAEDILKGVARQMPTGQTVIALKQVQDHVLLEPQRVPPGKIFRPLMKTEELKEKDFLGQSKVISSALEEDLKPLVIQGIPPPPGMPPPSLLQESQTIWKPGERKVDGADSEGPKTECLLEAPMAARNDGIYLKVHGCFTVKRKVHRRISLANLTTILQEEFQRQAATFQVRYKAPGSTDLITINSDEELRNLWQEVEGTNLTLWCQGEEEQMNRPVLYRMVAQHCYNSGAPEDLNFKDGDVLEILSEVNEDWLEGQSNGITGIFPKRFAEPECPAPTRL